MRFFNTFGMVMCFVVSLGALSASDQLDRVYVGTLKWQTAPGNNQLSRYDQEQIQQNLRAIINTAFTQTGRFEIYDRDNLDTLLEEINLSNSELSSMDVKSPQWGQLKGVNYLCIGSITEYGMQEHGKTRLGVGRKKTSLTLSIEVTIIDVQSGKYLFSDTVTNTIALTNKFKIGLDKDLISTTGALLGADYGTVNDLNRVSDVANRAGNSFQDESGPGGKVRNLFRQTASRIVLKMASFTDPLVILKPRNGKLILNYGSPLLYPGDRLEVFEKVEGEDLPDDFRDSVGVLIVDKVQRSYALAVPAEGFHIEQFSAGLECELKPPTIDEQFEAMRPKKRKKNR